jgi:glutamate dehydrogenase (NAD(P)+)
VGFRAAVFCHQAGARIFASEGQAGAIYSEAGLDPDKVEAPRKSSASILNFAGAKDLSASGEALELECDILIPAALENVITEDNAPRLKAKIVLEGANGPTTPGAEKILTSRGVMVIPDIYANAGGVTVSYFEWLKNLSHVRYGRMERRLEESSERAFLRAIETATGHKFTPQEAARLARGAEEQDIVNSGLEDTMIQAYNEIRAIRKREPKTTDLRTAAFVNAIDKVARSYMELGVFP